MPGQDVLDHDRRDDRVQVGAGRGVDQVAGRVEHGHDRVAGHSHGRAGRAHEDLVAFVQDVRGALDGDLVIALTDLVRALALVLARLGYFQRRELLCQGGVCHHFTSLSELPEAFAPRSSRMPRPCVSIRSCCPGGMTIVEYSISAMPGPATTLPGCSASKAYTSVSRRSPSSGQYADRLDFFAVDGSVPCSGYVSSCIFSVGTVALRMIPSM